MIDTDEGMNYNSYTNFMSFVNKNRGIYDMVILNMSPDGITSEHNVKLIVKHTMDILKNNGIICVSIYSGDKNKGGIKNVQIILKEQEEGSGRIHKKTKHRSSKHVNKHTRKHRK
jgi:hypothetical protein